MDNERHRQRLIEDSLRKQSRGLEDIIREHALPYLPAKSLAKFKCVCRDWRYWISNPFFGHNQSQSYRSISGLFYQTSGGPKFLSIDPNSSGIPDPSLGFLPVPVEVKTSCNGLLCCRAISGGDNRTYYVCNPATMEWRALPKPTRDHGPAPALVLIFEPSVFNFSADFKLICAFQASDIDDEHEFEIFSSESGKWRVSREIYFCQEKLIPSSGVYANGIVYWRTKYSILGFDLIKDRSRLIPLPLYDYSYSSGPGQGQLGELCGQICFVYASWDKVNVYVLEKTFSDKWSIKCTFSLASVTLSATERQQTNMHTNQTWPLPFQGGGSDVILKMGERILSYNIMTKTEKAICSGVLFEHVGTVCVPYINSLVSVKK